MGNVNPTRAELIERARALVPVLKERAQETERLRRIPPQTVQQIVDSGLLHVAVPPRYGGIGPEPDYDTAYDIAAELGRGCGASAWCYSLWAVHAWMVGHFPPPAQAEFYADGPDTLCSSSFFAGTDIECQPCDGGLRIRGRWEFSSGSDPAQWAMLGVGPPGLLALVPRGDYEVLDTWFASGLCGSGSNDLIIKDAFVPAHRLLDLNRAGLDEHLAYELHARRTYRLPLRVLLAWDLVAPLIGIAQAAVDAFVERARANPRMASSDIIQLRLAESSAEVDAARTLLRHTVDGLLAKAERGERFSDVERTRNQRDRAFVVRLCMLAVNRLFDSSGGHALFLSEPLQRCHRDAHAVSHRAGLMLDSVGPLYGRAVLGAKSQDT